MLAYVIAHAVGRLTLYSAIAKHAEAGDIRLLIDPGTLVIARPMPTAYSATAPAGRYSLRA